MPLTDTDSVDLIHIQRAEFIFENTLEESINIEQLHGLEDVGPTDRLPPDLFELEYQRFFGGSSPLTSPCTSSLSSRSTSPTRDYDKTEPSPTCLLLNTVDPPLGANKKRSRISSVPPPTPDTADPPPRAENSQAKRNKKRGRANRKKKRKSKQDEHQENSYVVSDRTIMAHVESAVPTETHGDAGNFPTASTGYIARPDRGGRIHNLKHLVETLGFKVERWDGRSSRPIVDITSRIIGVLVGRPNEPTWNAVHRGAVDAILTCRRKCAFPKKSKVHRRGKFPALSWGISYGGGQTEPGNLSHSDQNSNALSELTANDHISRIAGLASGAFATWAPKLYMYYESHLEKLLEHDPELRRNWPNSVWASFAVNFGPKTVCRPHRDFANLPFGLCAITALGDFDSTQGGHLVLWGLKLVIEFPAGSTILIPSAAISHSNVPISSSETRYSFTQYSAGGLFRWVEQGFMCTGDYMSSLTPRGLEEHLN